MPMPLFILSGSLASLCNDPSSTQMGIADIFHKRPTSCYILPRPVFHRGASATTPFAKMTLLRTFVSFVALLLFLSSVTATRFCQCENPTYDRIFPGINNVCESLGKDWCSTNCNTVGYNCDYCQFKPAGYGSGDDYHKLVSWCGKQQGYNSGSETHYKGTDVFCYSYKGRRPKKPFETGCPHQDNGDWPLPPDKLRDATVQFQYPFENKCVRRSCDELLRKDGPLFVDGYLNKHASLDCKWLKNETLSQVLECPYVKGLSNRDDLLQAFRDDCSYYGGQWHQLGNGDGYDFSNATAFLRVLSYGEYERCSCDEIKYSDSRRLAVNYLDKNSKYNCKAKKDIKLHVLECPQQPSSREFSDLMNDFYQACKSYGGKYHQLRKGSALALPVADAFHGQKILDRPHEFRANLIDSDQDSSDDPSNDTPPSDNPVDDPSPPLDNPDGPGDDTPPHGPGDVDKPDNPDKHHGNTIIEREDGGHEGLEMRVVYEHEGVKITFVD